MTSIREVPLSGVAPVKEANIRTYVGSSILTIFYSLGPALLAAPRFMHSLGIPLSITLMLISAAYAIYAQTIMFEAAYHTAATSFTDLFARMFQPWVYHLTVVASFLSFLPVAELLTLADQTIGVYVGFSNHSEHLSDTECIYIQMLYAIVLILPLSMAPRSSLAGLKIGGSIAGMLLLALFFHICVIFSDWKRSGYILSHKHNSPSIPIIPFEFHGKTTLFSPLYYTVCFWIFPFLVGQQNTQPGSYSSRCRWATITMLASVIFTFILVLAISIIAVILFNGICTAVDADCLLLQSNYILSLIYKDSLTGDYITPHGLTALMLLHTLFLILVAVTKTITATNLLILYTSKILERRHSRLATAGANTILRHIQAMAGYAPRLPVGRSPSEPELVPIDLVKERKKASDALCSKRPLYLLFSVPVVLLTLVLSLMIPDLAILSSLYATILGSILCVFVPIAILYKISYLRSMSAGRNIDLCAIATQYRKNRICEGNLGAEQSSSSIILDFYSSDTVSPAVSETDYTSTPQEKEGTRQRKSVGLRPTLKSIAAYSKVYELSDSRSDHGSDRDKGRHRDKDHSHTHNHNNHSYSLHKEYAADKASPTILDLHQNIAGSSNLKGAIHKGVTEADLEPVSLSPRKEQLLYSDTFKTMALNMHEAKLMKSANMAENSSADLLETLSRDDRFTETYSSEHLRLKERYTVGINIMGTLPDFSQVKVTTSRHKQIIFLVLIIFSICLLVTSLIFQIIFIV